MDIAEVKEMLQLYFDMCFEASEEKLVKVLHPAAHVYVQNEDGSLNDMDRDAFAQRVRTRRLETPPVSYPRQDEIISIDFIGENAAVARVKLRIKNMLYTDILSLIRADGKWVVISKLFAGETVN